MTSLLELVDRVNKGEIVDPDALEVYQESPNSAEKFLAHHARAMIDLRRAHEHMLQSLEAIEYSDQKVLNQYISVSGFLGLTDQRAEPLVRFGSSAIARRDYAMGMEAVQNGVACDLAHGGSYTASRENCQFIATQYDRAAQCLGWNSNQPIDWNNKQIRIAYIVSGIADDDSSSRMLRSLGKHHDSRRFKLQAYCTEAGVRRDRQQFAQNSYAIPSSKRGQATLDALTKAKITPWFAPTDGDVASAARELASQLVRDRIDVAIFDATQADPIAAVVADWEVARVKLNLARGTPLYSRGIQCVTYLDQARFEIDNDYWQQRGTQSQFILEGIDVDETLGLAPQRSAYGIPEQAVVLATVGNDLDRELSAEFVEMIISVLRAHPHAVYLLIGDGELGWQKRKFESSGVSKRIGYAGKRKDLPGFIRICDLYLCAFPACSANGVLQAMAMERPVVAMRWGDAAEQSQAAAFVGSEATIETRDTAAYIERVSKIIREPGYRLKLGKAMKSRIDQHFGFSQTARHLEQICDQLLQRNSDATVQLSDGTASPVATPTASTPTGTSERMSNLHVA